MNRKSLRILKSQLIKSRNNFKKLLLDKVLLSNNESLDKIINLIYNDSHLLKTVKCEWLPRKIEDMCKTKITSFGNNIVASLYWCVLLINMFSEKIEEYINLKEKYEKYLFSNNFEQAYAVIQYIEENICVSLWSIKQTFLLKECIGGLQLNKETLASYSKKARNNIIIQIILNFYSIQAEKNVSYINYQENIKKYLEKFEKEQNRIYQYFDYKLNLSYETVFENAIIPIQIDSQLSIIDTYETFIDMIQIISYTNKDFNIKDLLDKVNINNDYRIRNLTYQNSSAFNISDQSIEFYECLEAYTDGDYKNAILKIQNYIIKHPNDFQAYILLVKSEINNNNSHVEKMPTVFDNIYDIYTLNNNYHKSLYNLMLYYKLYNGTSWKYKLKGLISRKTGDALSSKYLYLSYINDINITPNYVFYMMEEKKKNLNTMYKFCPKTTGVFLYLCADNRKTNINNCITRNNIKCEIYRSTRLIIDKKWSEAIYKLKEIKNHIRQNDYYNIEKISTKLFSLYKKTEDYNSIIYMTVELYFINKYLIQRFDFSSIKDSLYNIDDACIKSDIRYPIFIYIIDKNNLKQQRIAYSNYMDSNDLNNIDDIININQSIDKQFVIFFLHKLCIQHLLKRDLRVILSKQNPDDLRIDILRKLIFLDENNYKIYFNEITSITTQKNIRHKMKQFNHSRIFVDTGSIRKEYNDLFREEFEKYVTIKNFENKITALDINDENNLLDIVSEINSKRINDVSYNQEYIVIKNLIIRILDELLFNPQYGLDTFLSSRIRHGFCKSAIRSAFEEYHLLSQKKSDRDEIYNINSYWEKILKVDNETFNKIQKCLSSFTYLIEKKVNEVKNDWIHIKVKSDDIGDFNYSTFVSASIFLVNNEHFNSFDVFFDNIVGLFDRMTIEILKNIRIKIITVLKDFFIVQLNDLEKQIMNIDNPACSQLINSLNYCKSKIDASMLEFAEIFNLEKVTYKDFTCNDLVETCIEINSKLNNNFSNVKINKKINDSYLLKGEYFSYFVDLTNQIINNAIEHSGLNIYQLQLNIITDNKTNLDFAYSKLTNSSDKTFSQDKKYLNFYIENNMDENLNVQNMKNKMESVFEKVQDKDVLKKYLQTEGGSGLYKIYTTLQYHIGEKYIIYYSIKKGTFLLGMIIEVDELIGN